MLIKDIKAEEILDSRGNPTVSATVTLDTGIKGAAFVPSGASTGKHEAVELRDADQERYGGLGVLRAVENINTRIKSVLLGLDTTEQEKIDNLMIELDGTENKANLGANAILAVSLAVARAAASALGQPLYQYLTKFNPNFTGRYKIPIPMMNVLNGGKHANWATDIQEYLIIPIGAKNIVEAVRMGAEVYHGLYKVLKDNNYSLTVGDEGGFSPAVKNNEENFILLIKAIESTKYKLGTDIIFGIDAAASEFFENGKYHLKKQNKYLEGKELANFYYDLQKRYPLYSLEDVFAEDDWGNFNSFTSQCGSDNQIIGDDLYVTNVKRLQRGIDEKSSNSILIKLNQIGTISETVQTMLLAHKNGFSTVVSHRSGETGDSFIADFTVAMGGGQIKTGSLARSERTAKYNRLMSIERELGDRASYASWPFVRN